MAKLTARYPEETGVYANERRQEYATLEHLLLALIEDQDAAAVMRACNVDLDLGTYHFPQVAIPEGETAYSLLAKRCFRGIARRYRPVPPRAVELLEKELRMIQQMGFAHYFLVVHDIVRWARARGGKGSERRACHKAWAANTGPQPECISASTRSGCRSQMSSTCGFFVPPSRGSPATAPAGCRQ